MSKANIEVILSAKIGKPETKQCRGNKFIRVITSDRNVIESINHACLSNDAKIDLFGVLYFCKSVSYDDDFVMTAVLIEGE